MNSGTPPLMNSGTPLIGNVNYGLLEKGGSTSYKSVVYKDLREAGV